MKVITYGTYDLLHEGQKIDDIQKYGLDIFAVGSDWEGQFDYLREYCRVVYLPRTEGISSTQLREASQEMVRVGIVGAIFFVLTTLFIGLWIVCGWWLPKRNEENSNQLIFSLIGRLSMVTLTISGAVFCTKQYIKQKNIIEDYAYKTTIAKSIAAFSEELREKSPEKYPEYISIILKEIYQDPLRERSNRNDAISISGNDIMEKILSIVQGQIDRNV